MNLTTITGGSSNTWKRIKGQYVAAAAGVALAASMALTVGLSERGGSTTAPAPFQPRALNVELARNVQPAQHFFYVVADEQARNELTRAINEHAMVQYDAAGVISNVWHAVVVAGPDAELLYGVGAAELTAAGVNYNIIDLTLPVKDQAASLHPQALAAERADVITLQEQLVVQMEYGWTAAADIAAGVLSSELATYGVSVPATKASDADIIAGALSSELATYAAPAPVTGASDADIMASVVSTELAHFGN